MNVPVKVLIVEDSEDDAKLALLALRRGGFDASHRRVQTAAELETALAAEHWDAVISDFNLPGFTGMDALGIFKAAGLDVPFILVSGAIGEEAAVQAMKAGANDYVMKQNLARLAPALERELKETQMRAAHRQAQRDLVASEQRLRTIIETEPECIKVVSREGVLLDMNAAGLAMLEADSLAAVQSQTLLDFIVPEHRAAFGALHQRVMRGESGVLEFEVIGLKGGRRRLETHAAPLAGADGKEAMLLGITRDITERTRAQQAILREKNFIISALDSLPGLFYVIDDQGRFLHWNKNFETVSGFSSEEISHRTATDFFAGPDKEIIAERMRQVFLTGEATAEADFVTKAGNKYPYFFTGRLAQIDQKPCLIGMGIDIAERKKAEEGLKLFRALIDQSNDAIEVVDADTFRYLDVNQKGCLDLGYSREEMLSLTIFDIDSTSDRSSSKKIIQSLKKSGSTIVEGRHRRKDGSEFPVEVSLRYIHLKREYVLAIARDITERKAAELRIVHLNRVYAMLSGINTLIVRVRDRDELFREACRVAVEAGGFRMSLIALADRSAMTIVPVASAGKDEALLAAIKGVLSSSDSAPNTMTARAIREKKAVVSNDSQSDPQVFFRKQYAESGIRSMAVLPLIVADEAVGVIALYTGEREFFHEEEMKLLTELTGDIAFAIDHLDKQARLDYLAYYDALTGLANRTLFLERLAQHLRSAAAAGHKLAVALIDLERFKNLNDSLGQPAGDELLRQVAAWLTRVAGDASLLARVGADHFVGILPQVKQDGNVVQLLEKTMKAFLEHTFLLNDAEFRVAAKVGVALFPDDGADADTLFRNAEAALKKAKASGDRYLFHTPAMTAAVAGKLALENHLRQALDRGEFVLHYQPKINFVSGKLTGAEALIRWNDPRTGLVPPGRFIPILEETGLIYEVGRWALRQAVEDYLRWRAAGLPAVRIAVNVSPLQLRSRGFIDEIGQVVAIDAHAAAGLELEITESLIMADVKRSIASLLAIRAMDVTIAIDNFGTGFSSLSYLAKLPVDTLKIDRSFVIDMTARAEGLALVSTIISLAHSLKLKAVAEGVETEEQSRLLRTHDCDEMQGFLFSKPVPGEIFETKFLAALPGG